MITNNSRMVSATFLVSAFVGCGFAQGPSGPTKITLDQAIEMALRQNHALRATRTTVAQNQALEIQANVRPNPTLFGDWQYLPLYFPEGGFFTYLQNATQADIGLSYTFERGQKRQHRLQAAKDTTAVSRAQVADNERTLTFQVAQLFINVQLAQSTLELAEQDLASFQNTVNVSQKQFSDGGASENDFLKVKLQLLTFQQDVEQAKLAKVQALSDLRQQLGYESVPAEYDIAGEFAYEPMTMRLDELQAKALENRPDLKVAQLGVSAATSQYELAKANGKQDVTVSGNYTHASGASAVTFSVSIPLPIFDRNQGNIAQTRIAMSQAGEQHSGVRGQVLTDVRDAYEGVTESDRVLQYYHSGYLETSKKSRDISEYAYRRGAATLLDFLDAERSFRTTQLAYRQALAGYLTALEQLREAVGSRRL